MALKPGSGISNNRVVYAKPALGNNKVATNQTTTKGLRELGKAASGLGSNGPLTGGPSALGPGNGTALPFDAVAREKTEAAARNRYNTDASIGASRATGLQEYGLEHELGANGIYYDDAKNNPYSQAAILQHNHESNERGLGVTQGQNAYSGQFANAQGIETGHFNQSHQELANAQARAKAQWLAEERKAQEDEERERTEAKEGAIQRASEGSGPEVPLKEKAPKPSQAAPKNKKWAYNSDNNRWHLVKA